MFILEQHTRDLNTQLGTLKQVQSLKVQVMNDY